MNDANMDKPRPELAAGLAAALAALAAAGQDRQADPAVEERLVTAFRARYGGNAERWRHPWALRSWIPTLAAAAMLLVAVGAWWRFRVPVPPVPAAPRVAVAPPVLPVQPVTAAAAVPEPQKRVSARRPGKVLGRNPEPDEGRFIPLPEAARLSPAESLDVVRVKMPRSAMMRFGLPVSAERAWEPVKADVVFGQDGMARAIRFVE